MLELPEVPNEKAFVSWWLWVAHALDILLEPQESFVSESGDKTATRKFLHFAKGDYENGISDGALDINMLWYLVSDLDYIRKQNPQCFLDLKSSLMSGKAGDFSNFTGIGFEVRITAMLLEEQLEFEKPEPPDFLVTVAGGTVGVECYAPRVTSESDIRKKTKNAVKKKERQYKEQEWTEGPTALIINATWLLRASGHDVIQGEISPENEFYIGFGEAIDSTRYDVIIALWFGPTREPEPDLRAAQCIYGPAQQTKQEVEDFISAFLLRKFRPGVDAQIILPRLPKDQ